MVIFINQIRMKIGVMFGNPQCAIFNLYERVKGTMFSGIGRFLTDSYSMNRILVA